MIALPPALARPEEVPPFFLIGDAQFTSGSTVSGDRIDITIDDVIASHMRASVTPCGTTKLRSAPV